MITNILRVIAVGFLAAGFTLNALPAIGQQPFDSLPTDPNEQGEQTPPLNLDDPIQIPADEIRLPTDAPQQPSDFAENDPDQTVIVDERFGGWWAAGEGANGGRLSETLRANWVMTDSNGLLTGKVTGINDADVSKIPVYLLNRGRLVTNVFTDEDGNFEINNVIEGAYSLVGIGDNAFFCFSFNALHYTDRPVGEQNAPTRLEVTAFQNKTTINLDWIRFFAPKVKFRVFGRYSTGEEATDPAEHLGFAGLALHQPAAPPATSISSHQVTKSTDGRLLGRIHQLNSLNGRPVNVRNTKVMLLKDDDVFVSTTTDNFGVFEFEGVPAGEYALVAASVDGLGCVGIEVSDSNGMGDGSTVFDFTMASSETVGWLNHLAHELAYERALLVPRPKDPSGQPYCNMCGGNGCNQCCGPGGRGRGFRRVIEAIDDWFDYRFYGETPNGGYGYYGGNYGGYGGGFYPGNGSYNQGFYPGYYGNYNRGYYGY